jgi:exodeoxyribonuclease V alpha subunit
MPPPSPADAEFYFVERETPEEISRTLCQLVAERIPRRVGGNAVDNVQVLSPMNRGSLGVRELNARLQQLLNPASQAAAEVSRFGWTYRTGDKVIQLENDYDREVYNGDIGRITGLDLAERQLTVRFDARDVDYGLDEIDALAPAYAITIHKSQGSEFPAVVIPVSTQHYVMLQRNLIYTGLTRGKRLVVLVGQRKALAMAIKNAGASDGGSQRWSGLLARLREGLT